MLEVKSYNGKYFIEIEVDKNVIREYRLENVIRNSYLVNHPKIEHSWQNIEGEGSVKYQFTLPPYPNTYGEEYYNFLESSYAKIVDEVGKEHHGNLLFLSYSYFIAQLEKRELTAEQNHFREKGKLLLDLLKVPIPRLNKNNIYDAFRGYPFYKKHSTEPQEVENWILSYLTSLSKREEEYYLKDGKIDFTKIDTRLWNKLTFAMQKLCCISIIIQEESDECKEKVLYVSQDIILKFQAKKYKAKNPLLVAEERFQNRQLLQVVIQQLFNEQKERDTDFYHEILKHDFFKNRDFRALSATVGDYYQSHHLYNLSRVYLALTRYIEENKLFEAYTNPETNRLKANFIYQYFVLLGLMHTNKNNDLTEYSNLLELKEALHTVEKAISTVKNTKKSRYAAIELRNHLKNYLPIKQRVSKKKESVI